MKKKLNVHLGAVFLSLLATSAFAQENHSTISGTTPLGPSSQYRTWSFGLNAGVLSNSNKFGFDDGNLDLGYSAYIKKQFTPSFGIKAQYLGGKMGGDIKTKIPWSAALSGEFTIANVNWRIFNAKVKPYAAAGIGTAHFEYSLTNSEETQNKIFVPVDAGFKFAIAKGINLDLGYQINWTNEYFDGKKTPSFKYDVFSYLHAGLEFAIGNKSKPAMSNSNPIATLIHDYTQKYDELKTERDVLIRSNHAAIEKVENLEKSLKDDDNDGVANLYDKCPNTPAGVKVDGSGCPLPEVKLNQNEQKTVIEAVRNLEFDFSTSTIRSSSYPYLDQVAALLQEKSYNLKLDGHTDNVGSQEINSRISKQRAEAVKDYLVSKGISPSRIETTGYGFKRPLTTNNTEKGRQQNRRVEFTLF
ncbi:OmpA family protein [Sphingobacterium faecale]|uniref:OmpA family protein n=1 Tax=Sphingobacterium faecale TaxID=2803775 RepID=A0ABS1R5B0_9SPHI|nr:OmpA family protein [Sphingobacterium faecale]MBL1409880.1 OmpA family protein [Sphingobacterium faecale]